MVVDCAHYDSAIKYSDIQLFHVRKNLSRIITRKILVASDGGAGQTTILIASIIRLHSVLIATIVCPQFVPVRAQYHLTICILTNEIARVIY